MSRSPAAEGGERNLAALVAWAGFGVCLLFGVANAAAGLTRADSIGGIIPSRPADLDYTIQALALALAGVVVASKRPENRVWLVLTASAIASTAFGFANEFTLWTQIRHPGSVPGGQVAAWFATWLFQPIPTLLALLFFIFPTGRALSRRWAWAMGLMPLYILVGWVPPAFLPGWTQNTVAGVGGRIQNPLAIKGAESFLQGMVSFSNVVLAAAFVLGVASLVARYRRAGSEERQQLKFFVFAAALAPLGFLLYPVYSGPDAMAPIGIAALVVSSIGIDGLPIAIALAIIKYRLYDIDVVISRTLVYGSLAAFITAVYVGIVVGVGTLVGSGGRPNLVLSIVATGIVAVAFQPVRERVQKVANRLVYGKRATPYEVLSQFSERVAETYAADEALPRMARVLAEGTGAERAQVWLRAGALLRPAATWPESSGAEEPVPLLGDYLPDLPGEDVVPVKHQGELLGALTVTKRVGESLTPIEQKLLDDLAHQAGLVLKNVGLTAELLARLEDLRASRQRLVAAQDDERRRLERNLHDGAQQNLVAIKVKLGLVEMFAERDPARAKALLEELKSDTGDALDTLRDLARGIYPPLLADKGLGAALESQARKATLPVAIEDGGIGRYPQETEAAIYFCVLEALQNVQKYAGANQATVRLSDVDGELQFEVEDDGQGFDPAVQQKGSGTQNMEDRLDALGGSVSVRSSVGAGTMVRGRLPIAVAEEELQPV
jgi:signal transduction histidine kinase